MSLYEIFAYFFLYSFLGWVTEVAYHAVKTGKFVNRGFLNGPVCPIYGVGVVAVLLILGRSAEKPWLVFIVGLAFPTAVELFTGWALEKFFHNKWWDYSDRKFNFKGYVCLEFSLLWAFAVLLVVEVLHPFVRAFAGLFGELAGDIILGLFCVAMLVDVALTVMQVLKFNRRLAEIDEIARAMRVPAEAIGKKVASATLVVEKGVSAAGKRVESVKDALSERWNEALLAAVRRTPKRLLKAFPRLVSRRNPDSVTIVKEGMEEMKSEQKERRDS